MSGAVCHVYIGVCETGDVSGDEPWCSASANVEAHVHCVLDDGVETVLTVIGVKLAVVGREHEVRSILPLETLEARIAHVRSAFTASLPGSPGWSASTSWTTEPPRRYRRRRSPGCL